MFTCFLCVTVAVVSGFLIIDSLTSFTITYFIIPVFMSNSLVDSFCISLGCALSLSYFDISCFYSSLFLRDEIFIGLVPHGNVLNCLLKMFLLVHVA